MAIKSLFIFYNIGRCYSQSLEALFSAYVGYVKLREFPACHFQLSSWLRNWQTRPSSGKHLV